MAKENNSPQKKQTPSSISEEHLIYEARRVFLPAKSEPQVALEQIQDLCNKHTNSGILLGAQAHILDICYDNLVSDDKKKIYLDNALDCARKSIKLSPNSIVFSAFLGHLLLKSSNNAEDCMNAFEQFNTALNISDPTDPLEESPQAQSCFSRTYEDRVDDVRDEILYYLVLCVLNLKELGVEPSIIILKLQSLNVEKKDKVGLYWNSLSPNEKQNFLRVDVGDLKSSLVSSMKDSEGKILSDALSFYDAHKHWEFLKCCRCERSFLSSSLYFIHIATTHLEKLLSELWRAYPVRVSDWAATINKIEWKPLDASAASTMIKMNKELLSSKVTESLKKIKWRSSDDSAASTMRKMNRQLLSSKATSELLEDKYDVNRDVHKWKWPSSTDPKRMDLLSMIQESLKELLLNNRLLVTHIDILRRRALSKLDDLFRDLLIEFGLDRTHHCFCFLDASQLKDIFSLLQEMYIFTGKRSIMEDDSRAFEINGDISLSSDSLHLILDEDSLRNESDNSLATSDSPDVGNLILWIYSGPSHDQLLETWRDLRAEKEYHGKEELVKYEKCLPESLRDLHEFQEGVSLAVIPTVVSNLKVREVIGFSLQKPPVDTSTQITIHKKSENNDSKLSKSDKQILQFAVDMHQLEITLNCSAAYSYQPIVLSIVKQYIRERLEGIMDKDTKKMSDGSFWKDLGTEEERHQLEMKESSGASIGKDLGTEEVTHPLGMKESIMDPQVGYGDIRSSRRQMLDEEEFDLAEVDEADQRWRLTRRT